MTTPYYFLTDDTVERLKSHEMYDDRDPTDFVVGGFVGPNRRFETRAEARRWVKAKYGKRVRRALPNCVGRWGFLVRAEAE